MTRNAGLCPAPRQGTRPLHPFQGGRARLRRGRQACNSDAAVLWPLGPQYRRITVLCLRPYSRARPLKGVKGVRPLAGRGAEPHIPCLFFSPQPRGDGGVAIMNGKHCCLPGPGRVGQQEQQRQGKVWEERGAAHRYGDTRRVTAGNYFSCVWTFMGPVSRSGSGPYAPRISTCRCTRGLWGLS